jgi:hypothetical protein
MALTSLVDAGQLSTIGERPGSRSTTIAFSVVSFWLGLVVFTATRHEFWRDEVRALSLARAADSPLDLYTLVQYDGHPLLWHLVLFLGTSIVDTPLVLPIASIIIAFAAVAVFMWSSPFPLWFRCAFIFGALPVFEYSVMARNYGISMLLLFLAAILYRTRSTHPFRLAFVLALLANTNVHSAMFACLIAAAWAWDIAAGHGPALVASGFRRYLPLVVVAAGVLLCFVSTAPRENTILTAVRDSAGLSPIWAALRRAVLRPDLTFPDLIPSWVRPKPAILVLYGAIAGLFMRPNLLLAALAAQTAFGVFFQVVYAGRFRHQGLYLVFLVFLYWLYMESPGARAWAGVRRLGSGGGLFGAVLILVLFDLGRAPRRVWADINGTKSASQAFGVFLRESPHFHDAVIVPEPDFRMESLPYYAGNRIYLPREARFATTVSWTTASKAHLTLGELLRAARAVRSSYGSPVLIVLAPTALDSDAGQKRVAYGKVFSWTSEETAEFRSATRLLRDFDASEGDEDYRVFLLDEP